MAEELQYEDILVYVARIREAHTPLGILVNTDFLTDILDMNYNKEEVLKRYGTKTQMERDQLRNNLRRTAQRNIQVHRLYTTLREINSNYKSEVCRQ